MNKSEQIIKKKSMKKPIKTFRNVAIVLGLWLALTALFMLLFTIVAWMGGEVWSFVGAGKCCAAGFISMIVVAGAMFIESEWEE